MRRLALLLLLIGFGLNCGRKGPPLPPLREVPETTTDLTVYQEEKSVVLRWSYPSLTRSGRPLGKLASVEVWKAELPLGQEHALEGPRGPELKRQLLLGRGKLLARLTGSQIEAATTGSFFYFRDDFNLSPEQVPLWSLYAVRSRKAEGGFSDFSNVVAWQPTTPPPAPEGLEATPTPQGIALRWESQAGVSYRIERQGPEKVWEVLGETKDGQFLDASAKQGKQYLFRIRASNRQVIGLPSSPIAVHFRDVFPPPAPRNLLCLPEEGRVILRWEAVEDERVKYKVFRRLGEGPWVHLDDNAIKTVFEDKAPPLGELTYVVKAVDGVGNESEPTTCKARGQR